MYQAVNLLAEHCHKNPYFSINILKNIPIAAGLGGGSADAAAILKYLCNKWKIEITQEIYDIALKIGADVPACLYRQACLVKGIGEDITKIKEIPHLPIVLVNPGIVVSTKIIFQKVHKYSTNFINHVSSNNILETIINSQNDLQGITTALYPKINRVIAIIQQQQGCIISRISGSGSTCFGLFNNMPNAKKAMIALSKEFQWVRMTSIY